MIETLVGFVAMFALMTLRVPIAFSMAVVGFAGLWLMRSWPAAVASTTTEILDIAKYTLSVVPLFVLMGNFVTRAGMSRELYAAAYSFIGDKRGGLAMSTVAACAGFGAICGSSIATTATMARVAMPEMRRFRYRDSFAAGSIMEPLKDHREDIAVIRGLDFKDSTNHEAGMKAMITGNGTETVKRGAGWTDLANAANWDRVASRKQVPIAFLTVAAT